MTPFNNIPYKFILGIEFVQGIEWLQKAVTHMQELLRHILIIDNSPDAVLRTTDVLPPHTPIFEPPVPLSFSQTMNFLHRRGAAETCDAIIVCHPHGKFETDDLQGVLQKIARLQQKGQNWGAVISPNGGMAGYSMKAVKTVGPWDVTLTREYSDLDYFRRIFLARFDIVGMPLPIATPPFFGDMKGTAGQQDIKTQETLSSISSTYYLNKWGGYPGKEKWGRPFDCFALNPVEKYLDFS